MKNHLLTLAVAVLALLLVPCVSQAQNAGQKATAPIQLLSTTVVADGAAVRISGGPAKTITFQLGLTGGTLTSLTCALEGSVDGTKWFSLGSHTTVTDGSVTHSVDKPVFHIRARLTARVVATGAPVIVIKAAAFTGRTSP